MPLNDPYYEELYRQIAREIAAAEPQQALARVVERLSEAFDRYTWTGIYLVQGDELVLGPWRGPAATEHVRIPIGQGVCGAAARSGRIENVPDVHQDPRYLACFTTTRSEIVVPIKDGEVVYGEIDIDSDQPAAFDAADELFLARVAALLVPAARSVAGAGRRVTGD
ncbi:MAG: diguanylate cyclase [Chloroflexota bacterium]